MNDVNLKRIADAMEADLKVLQITELRRIAD